jgi:drug/metabolite transporter (DMT)-like permease
LLLFGTTQLTMFLYGLVTGEKYSGLSIAGMLIALSGMVYLLLPNIHAPPLMAAALMIIAGAAWGAYTLCGRKSKAPMASTAWNFIATLPLLLISGLIFYQQIAFSTYGLLLAILSGALASALGYVIWYSVLPSLSATTAASSQLSVPVITAVGGVVFMAEGLTAQLVISSVITLGGIYLSIRASRR